MEHVKVSHKPKNCKKKLKKKKKNREKIYHIHYVNWFPQSDIRFGVVLPHLQENKFNIDFELMPTM